MMSLDMWPRFAEAVRTLLDMPARLAAGLPPPDDRMTVGLWLDRWDSQIDKKAYKTQVNYRQIVRDNLPPDWALGPVRLSALNPDRVQRWLDELDDRNFPPPTIKYSLDILRIAHKAAMSVSADRTGAHGSAAPR